MRSHAKYAAEALIETGGPFRPSDLSHVQITQATAKLGGKTAGTVYARRSALRRILDYLRDEYGAPNLRKFVPRSEPPSPRNVTVELDVRARLLAAAEPYMRCWLLLCSDLAIRSGTSAKLGPQNYDPSTRLLSFVTKYNRALTLPATEELHVLIAPLARRGGTVPFVSMLHQGGSIGQRNLTQQLHHLKRRLGLVRAFTVHDLRRTTATEIYDQTRDLRVVQAVLGHKRLDSTMHYLDHRNTPVSVSTLELAKRNPLTERPQ